jgi:hypothetical protein
VADEDTVVVVRMMVACGGSGVVVVVWWCGGVVVWWCGGVVWCGGSSGGGCGDGDGDGGGGGGGGGCDGVGGNGISSTVLTCGSLLVMCYIRPRSCATCDDGVFVAVRDLTFKPEVRGAVN